MGKQVSFLFSVFVQPVYLSILIPCYSRSPKENLIGFLQLVFYKPDLLLSPSKSVKTLCFAECVFVCSYHIIIIVFVFVVVVVIVIIII